MVKPSLSDREYEKLFAEARKDPQFRKDIRKFIKITTGTYKLKDYGLENIGLLKRDSEKVKV